tara:strand:+ start:46 stop:591 length:546 start_codon:yes stop_codon:yes gene_type:complete
MKKIIGSTAVFIILLITFSVAGTNTTPNKKLLLTAKQLQRNHFKKLKNGDRLVIIDYSLPVFKKRLWVINTKTDEIIFYSRVGHAWRSGIIYATNFSNVPKSNKSSIGSFVTTNTYKGKFGYSLNIKGLDKGVNNFADRRRIIFHKMTNKPWSLGCFTVPQKSTKKLINLIKSGTFVYVSS